MSRSVLSRAVDLRDMRRAFRIAALLGRRLNEDEQTSASLFFFSFLSRSRLASQTKFTYSLDGLSASSMALATFVQHAQTDEVLLLDFAHGVHRFQHAHQLLSSDDLEARRGECILFTHTNGLSTVEWNDDRLCVVIDVRNSFEPRTSIDGWRLAAAMFLCRMKEQRSARFSPSLSLHRRMHSSLSVVCLCKLFSFSALVLLFDTAYNEGNLFSAHVDVRTTIGEIAHFSGSSFCLSFS